MGAALVDNEGPARFKPAKIVFGILLKAMRVAESEYRLNWGASWLKLCGPDPAIEDPQH